MLVRGFKVKENYLRTVRKILDSLFELTFIFRISQEISDFFEEVGGSVPRL